MPDMGAIFQRDMRAWDTLKSLGLSRMKLDFISSLPIAGIGTFCISHKKSGTELAG
jgi:hypothetical protein